MKIATLISRLFDPFVMFGLSVVLIFWNTNQLIPAIFLYLLLPFILFVIAWKIKLISNWDVTDRRERPRLLWTMFAIETVGTVFFHLTPIIPYLCMLLGFILITHFWKISGHTFASATFAGIIMQTYGLAWWPVLCVPFIVGWSRVYRHNHTLSQAIAGGIYPIVCMYFFL